MAEATTGTGKTGGWVIAWGVLLIVTGIVAIVAPGVAALAAALVLAWLFVVAGVVQLIYAIHQRGHDGFAWKLISALATLVLGIVMLAFPIASIASIALLIGAFLAASGISTIMLAFKLRPKAGWGWVLFDGALSIAIAILIASGWPQSSIEFVGILVGFCLISGGFWRIMLGRRLRNATPTTG